MSTTDTDIEKMEFAEEQEREKQYNEERCPCKLKCANNTGGCFCTSDCICIRKKCCDWYKERVHQ